MGRSACAARVMGPSLLCSGFTGYPATARQLLPRDHATLQLTKACSRRTSTIAHARSAGRRKGLKFRRPGPL